MRFAASCLAMVLLALCCWIAGDALAQQAPANSVTGVATGAQVTPVTTDLQTPKSLTGFFSSRTPYEFWLTVLNVCFGMVTLGIVLLVFRQHIEKYAEQLIRFAIVVVIVVGTLVLITAGYSNEQVAPAFGLFGTIVGYILGRMSGQTPPPAEAKDKEAKEPDKGKGKGP